MNFYLANIIFSVVNNASVESEEIPPLLTRISAAAAGANISTLHSQSVSNTEEPALLVETVDLLPPSSFFDKMSRKEKGYELCTLSNQAGFKVSQYKRLLNGKKVFNIFFPTLIYMNLSVTRNFNLFLTYFFIYCGSFDLFKKNSVYNLSISN